MKDASKNVSDIIPGSDAEWETHIHTICAKKPSLFLRIVIAYIVVLVLVGPGRRPRRRRRHYRHYHSLRVGKHPHVGGLLILREVSIRS